MPYWDDDPTENLFMEVTKSTVARDNLLVPRAKSGSGAAFNLAQSIRSGDKVVHYNSKERAIVAVSSVIGDPEPTIFDWSSASAGVRAGLHEGILVPLGSKVDVVPPITLAEIKQQQEAIFSIKRDLESRTRDGEPLNFPWIKYQGDLRTALPYLAKFPKAALALFPRLNGAIGTLA